jgi:hypothetical protein
LGYQFNSKFKLQNSKYTSKYNSKYNKNRIKKERKQNREGRIKNIQKIITAAGIF